MPRAFIFSSHGSMPMIDDESFALPEFPEFPDLSKQIASKKTLIKKTLSKKPVSKKPVATVIKKSTNKKSTNKKSAKNSAADSADPLPALPPPFGLSFAAMSAVKKPDSFESPVDTFTTAKCGYPFCADLRCDAPYVGLVHKLSELHLPPHVPKNEVREIIKQTMLDIRCEPRHADALTRAENKIRCHKKGSPITELFLFGPSHELPILESVTMVDMETGEIRDAHEMFGLVEKHAPASTPHGAAAQHDDESMAGLQYAKQRAAWDLHTLQCAHPFYVDMKKEHIKTIDDTIAGNLNESKFEYSAELKAVHGERVKLSDLLRIGMFNGLNPETDFAVVYACRVPDEGTLGAQKSPRNSDDSEQSVGGTRSKKCKRPGRSAKRSRGRSVKRRSANF